MGHIEKVEKILFIFYINKLWACNKLCAIELVVDHNLHPTIKQSILCYLLKNIRLIKINNNVHNHLLHHAKITVTIHGLLEQNFLRTQFHAYPRNLIDINDINKNKKISVREAAGRDSICGAQGYYKCNCKTGCENGRCNCYTNNKLCNSKCHNSTVTCNNKHE